MVPTHSKGQGPHGVGGLGEACECIPVSDHSQVFIRSKENAAHHGRAADLQAWHGSNAGAGVADAGLYWLRGQTSVDRPDLGH